ncbi:MAG TPA: sigma-70 family RNA polymerase sigma factor [Armatimonadota bacterium]
MDGIVAVFTRTKALDVGPDAHAIARCKAGDADAFVEIVDRYQGMVNSVVSRALRDPDDAADVAQEVFVRAYRSLHTFRAESKFSTWLYRIALNTAIRHAGKSARERRFRAVQDPEMPDMLAGLPSDPAEGPEEQAWRNISHEALRNAVHSLPEKQRAVVVLHFFEGKTCEEIAEILNVNLGTVWSRIHYAVKRLRLSMGDVLDAA